MTNNWIVALKEYNKNNKNEWCVPKKGSYAYDKLKQRQKELDKPEQAKREKAANKIQAFVKAVKFRSGELVRLETERQINRAVKERKLSYRQVLTLRN